MLEVDVFERCYESCFLLAKSAGGLFVNYLSLFYVFEVGFFEADSQSCFSSVVMLAYQSLLPMVTKNVLLVC